MAIKNAGEFSGNMVQAPNFQGSISALGSISGMLTDAQNQRAKEDAILYQKQRDITGDERAQQDYLLRQNAGALAEKQYDVTKTAAENAQINAEAQQKMTQQQISESGRHNLATEQNQKFGLGQAQAIENARIARENKTNTDILSGLAMDRTTTTPSTETKVATGNQIFTPTGDMNTKYDKLLPTEKESKLADEAQMLSTMNKDQKEEYLKKEYLLSSEAKEAGANKTGVQRAVQGLEGAAKALDPDTWLLQAGKSLGEWNKPESEKIGKVKTPEVQPRTYEQYRDERLSDIAKADTKVKSLADKVLKENSIAEIKTETIEGKKVPISPAAFGQSLAASTLDPAAKVAVYNQHLKEFDKYEENQAKTLAKAQDQKWHSLNAQEKANIDVWIAQKTEEAKATTDPVMRQAKLNEISAATTNMNYKTAEIKKKGSSVFGTDVEEIYNSSQPKK